MEVSRSLEVHKIPGGKSGDGTTTRYWDCCKPSCAWKENIKTPKMIPVASCGKDGATVVNASVRSGCLDNPAGHSYMCSNQQPWLINSTYAMGFAAVSFTGGADTKLCCACFELSFGGALQGKKMVLQNTNTGGDLGKNQFDIAIPGGGVGIFTLGCSSQWGTGPNGWGDQYGGVHSASECSKLPSALQSGCKFRFDFMSDVSNPPVHFEQVTCPTEIVGKTHCEA